MLITITDILAQLIDRPVGLTPVPLIAPYHDRFIVLTREKLSALASAGSGTDVDIEYVEPANDPVLGGNYRLRVRVERIE